jgi:hypothetical protein
MKKFILFVFFALSTFYYGYSQSLTLADSTGLLANNANVTRQGHSDGIEITSFFFVHNTTSATVAVMVKKVEISLIAGSVNTFCWAGTCFGPNVYVSPDPEYINAHATDSTDFSGHYTSAFPGASIIRYVFFIQSNPSDSVCVNVTYNAYPVGIDNQTARNILSGAFPNPANNTVNFEYSINTENAGTVIIRNLLGSVVKKSVLTSAEGKLSVFTGDLPEGIYFYSLDMDGKAMTTRKLIISH